MDEGCVELAGAESCALDSVLDDVEEPVAANTDKGNRNKEASKNGSRKNLIGFPEGGVISANTKEVGGQYAQTPLYWPL